jgi:hypothetical protein
MDDPSTWAATRSRNGAGDVKRDGASGVYRCRRDSPDGLEGIRPVLKPGGEESRKKPPGPLAKQMMRTVTTTMLAGLGHDSSAHQRVWPLLCRVLCRCLPSWPIRCHREGVTAPVLLPPFVYLFVVHSLEAALLRHSLVAQSLLGCLYWSSRPTASTVDDHVSSVDSLTPYTPVTGPRSF